MLNLLAIPPRNRKKPKPSNPALVLLGTMQGAIRRYMNLTVTSYDDRPSVDEEELLELGSHGQKETLRDVKVGLGLTKSQEENVWQVL